MKVLRQSLFGAGLVAGPLAWGVTLQTAYTLVSAECSTGSFTSLVVTIVGALVALAGTAASWNARGALDANDSRYFVATIASAAGGLFAIAILFQMAATFVFEGCEL
jgi:hypothetical protein